MNRVLAVDDDTDVRMLIEYVLRAAGYRVDGVSDGAAAIDALERRSYDVVVLDNSMPVMSGLQVLRACRDVDPRPVFVMVSALDNIDDQRAAFEAGADDLLAKPFHPLELVRLISELTTGRRH